MLNVTTDQFPDGSFFEDWILERFEYAMDRQYVELDLVGPSDASDRYFRARFERVVYYSMYTVWDLPFWQGSELESEVAGMAEIESLPEISPGIMTSDQGTRLSTPVGVGIKRSERYIAPSNVTLRFFVLVTSDLTLKLACGRAVFSTNT